ncbi:hypothetical protein VTK73DRAFT_4256 [Phialemonium thermophilum]|uniref:Uncharacterized protein n=1 Tax=Phialemonium thermophilum TaxID=223376 RepID=A0ABR3VAC3_9PEZI
MRAEGSCGLSSQDLSGRARSPSRTYQVLHEDGTASHLTRLTTGLRTNRQRRSQRDERQFADFEKAGPSKQKSVDENKKDRSVAIEARPSLSLPSRNPPQARDTEATRYPEYGSTHIFTAGTIDTQHRRSTLLPYSSSHITFMVTGNGHSDPQSSRM